MQRKPGTTSITAISAGDRSPDHPATHPPCRAKVARALRCLQEAKLRVTKPRRAILALLASKHGPFTMEEVHRRLPGHACDLVTVYRSLAAMERKGLVRACHFGDGAVRYELGGASGHHHHHVICRKCRRVETLHVCLVDALDRMVRERGYSNVDHALEFFGTCPRCQKAGRSSS
ncbi:MAG: Fur family transcriptional regulator [Verrucomicrobiia bacterium]